MILELDLNTMDWEEIAGLCLLDVHDLYMDCRDTEELEKIFYDELDSRYPSGKVSWKDLDEFLRFWLLKEKCREEEAQEFEFLIDYFENYDGSLEKIKKIAPREYNYWVNEAKEHGLI